MTSLKSLTTVSAMALILLGPSCGTSQEEDEGTIPQATVTVDIAHVTESDAIVTVLAYGKTKALRSEKVFAPLAGKIIVLNAFDGTTVRKGDQLVAIQTRESQAAILGARAMLQSATTPQKKKEAEEALKLAMETQHAVSVLASFAGVIASRKVSEGELVSENDELATIVDRSSIVFLAEVLLRDLMSVEPDQKAQVQFQTLTGSSFPAVVEAISPETNGQSQTVTVRLRFSSLTPQLRSLLRTEMMGTTTIATAVRPHALFVPRSSLLRNDEDDTYSVVTITDSLAIHVPVTVGVFSDSTVEIQSTLLHPGTVVITTGAYSLADSTRVIVSQPDPE